MSNLKPTPCAHCRAPIPPEAPAAVGGLAFCCAGCATVYRLLHDAGLERYYDLAGSDVAAPPSSTVNEAPSHDWLTPLLEAAQRAAPGTALCALEVDIQGVHCAACVWLMQETFRRRSGAVELTVNPGLGKARLVWRRGELAVESWVREVEAFGYRFGPARKQAARGAGNLVMRLGISSALALNVMLFSVSFYFGLAPTDGAVFRLFTWLSFALASAVVAIGGWPFFRGAVRGLRAGVLHLDLPIAVGIALVYLLSLLQLRQGRGDVAYFDTLDVFICLMLAGRLIQDRVLERNRRFLLEDDGAEGIAVRVLRAGRVAIVPAPEVRAGEHLVVAPGDLVPVEATLLDARAAIRTDWITGEADVQSLAAGALVPAGAVNAGTSACLLEARTAFADSPLVALLRSPMPRTRKGAAHQRPWDALARGWVLAVLAIAALGFLLWLPRGLDAAANVAAALLVVTCPCAIGLAIPLAYELTQSRLRRAGFYVRSADLLDRLARVRKLLFDKTGTLTLGRLELCDSTALAALAPEARDAAYNLAARSSHPASACLARALEQSHQRSHEGTCRFDAAAVVTESPGQGLELLRSDGHWRLGRADWATLGRSSAPFSVLARDGVVLASLATRELLRPDAARQIAELAGAGYETWLLSGDGVLRVQELAAQLQIPAERALAALLPEAKAAVVASLDAEDTLYFGDGINDALAFEAAYAAGTPAIDRPVMPGKSDFFTVGEGLAPLAAALAAARRLQRVVRALLVSSIVYNVGVVLLCLAGRMSPLLAAVLMPASTLFLLSRTVWMLSGRAALSPFGTLGVPVVAPLPSEVSP